MGFVRAMTVPSTAAAVAARFGFTMPLPATGWAAGRAIGADPMPAHVYPATGEPIGAVQICDAAAVDEAVGAARVAFASGAWSRRSVQERIGVLRACAARLRNAGEELAALQMLETGIPFSQAMTGHIPRMAENFEIFADIAATQAGRTFQQVPGYVTHTLRAPVGVAAIFAPWNAPLVLSSMKLAAALAVGCTAVIKPSEYTPFSVLRMVQILEEAGLAPGVVNVVNGPGAITGRALSEHEDVAAIGFIGGTETGKTIMRAAAGRLAKVGLELGGKSANIITASADLEAAVDGSLLAIYTSAGQQCLAGSRIFLERAIAAPFLDRFQARARAIRLGCPLDPSTEMGPIAHPAHLARILDFVAAARAQGAQILAGGERVHAMGPGLWLEPILALAPSNDLTICQEEIFGPFATVQVVETLDEAIARANDSRFGLVGYVWAQDIAAIMRVTDQLETGTVWVNTPLVRDLRAPFGGWKQSGLGRDGREGCIDLFTEEKAVMTPIGPVRMRKLGAP